MVASMVRFASFAIFAVLSSQIPPDAGSVAYSEPSLVSNSAVRLE